MRRFTTSAATDRPLLGFLLLVEVTVAAVLLVGPAATPAEPVSPVPALTPTASSPRAMTLRDGRAVTLIALGGPRSGPLLARVAAEIAAAADAVTTFWGDDWPRDIVIAAAGSDEQFRTLAGGGPGIAATATAQRIVFAPGAAAMSDASLRIVLRHELFHYAARADTTADAPRWLTEGVADYVARPATPRDPAQAAALARIPADADFDAAGAARSLAYDRAWWFTRFVADRHGAAALRLLYLRACGAGHPDAATAVRDVLGADLAVVSLRWRQWLAE